MRIDRLLNSLLLASCAACAPLLDADFDDQPESDLFDETVTLPGPPAGDRMIIANFARIDNPTGSGDHVLQLFRSAIVGRSDTHGEVYLDPIDASDTQPIFFSWRGTIAHFFPDNDIDLPVVAIKLRDLTDDDQPSPSSKLIIRYGEENITASVPPGAEVSIGNGVTGSHTVILRIDPGPKTYAFFIGGDGVSPAGGFTHNGSLAADETIDPENIGLSISFADEITHGTSIYTVNDVVVSQREP